MKIFINGLTTGLFLQLAIGPVFFFIVNLALQKTLLDGLVAVLAVVLVDYFYIGLAVLGIGKLLEQEKIKKVFGIISSLILIIFGLLIFKNIVDNGMTNTVNIDSANLFSSFTSVFLLTISNPMTIVFFTGLFTAKAIEYNYKKRELYIWFCGRFSNIIIYGYFGNFIFFSERSYTNNNNSNTKFNGWSCTYWIWRNKN